MSNKPASLVRVGMKADDVLKLRQRGAEFALRPPTSEGQDDEGWIAVWHYIDCDVVLHRRNGCYRVKEVREINV